MPPLHLLEAEAARLRRQIEVCESDWKRVPRLFATCLVGLPVTYVSGIAWGFVSVAIALSFVGTSAYLIGVRKREYEHELTDIERDIAAERKRGSTAS